MQCLEVSRAVRPNEFDKGVKGLRSSGAGSVVSCVQTVTGEPTNIYRPNGRTASE